MTFYQKCLGGKLSFQTIGETTLSETMPARMKKTILHASLMKEQFILMGTDIVDEKGLFKGNAVSLFINCATEKEIVLLYKRLSKGGEQTCPLKKTFWNALFGGLTDKYGNHWLLTCDDK